METLLESSDIEGLSKQKSNYTIYVKLLAGSEIDGPSSAAVPLH
jgi:hypothetical protein